MRIDTSIVSDYLSGGCDYKKHWLFKSIAGDGKLMFDPPCEDAKQSVQSAIRDALDMLYDFHPLNAELFQRLFPKWKTISENVNIIFAVGCPAPYDAMVREHDGEEFIIFDLIRLLDYNMDLKALIVPLITHELAHVCLHAAHPVLPSESDYRRKLKYIVFDEGFAHLIAFRDGIESFDFAPLIQEHYPVSLAKLKSAMAEEDKDEQLANLEYADSGKYWNKFGAICGKLFLAKHLESIESIYDSGPEGMFDLIEKDIDITL